MLSVEFNPGPQDPRVLAAQMLGALFPALGEGSHHLLCFVSTSEGPLHACMVVGAYDDDILVNAHECASFCTTIAVGVSPGMTGALVARTVTLDDSEMVRGWALADGWAHALNAAEVFDAYCKDEDGEPIPPEFGVDHRAGIPLRHPLDG